MPTPGPAPCCRQKATEGEAKLRAAVQDKTNAQLEKAGLERELKGLRAQAEKLTKNMDKVGVVLLGCTADCIASLAAVSLWPAQK
jgi:hypothetical protein